MSDPESIWYLTGGALQNGVDLIENIALVVLAIAVLCLGLYAQHRARVRTRNRLRELHASRRRLSELADRAAERAHVPPPVEYWDV